MSDLVTVVPHDSDSSMTVITLGVEGTDQLGFLQQHLDEIRQYEETRP